MAIQAAPDLRVAAIDWSLDRPGQVNTSTMTGKRTVPANPWHGKWSASVTLTPLPDEDSFRKVRSLLMRLRGQVHSFRLGATVESQNANSGVTVGATVAAGVTSMTLSGASTPMANGQMVTVNDQLLQLTAAQSGSTITFQPALRAQATIGTAIETSRPTALVRLAEAAVAWRISNARFEASFDVEEAF